MCDSIANAHTHDFEYGEMWGRGKETKLRKKKLNKKLCLNFLVSLDFIYGLKSDVHLWNNERKQHDWIGW